MTEKKSRGMVQVFTGNGKGKTTAALGSVLRAAGHGWKVFIIFFIKGKGRSGEHVSLAKLTGVDVARFGLSRFADPENITPEDREQAQRAMAAAREAVMGGKYDLVVLDEINVAMAYHLIAAEEVIELIKNKPDHVELILTGRYADKRVLELADLVTEMVNIKHPFERGIAARKGIEF